MIAKVSLFHLQLPKNNLPKERKQLHLLVGKMFDFSFVLPFTKALTTFVFTLSSEQKKQKNSRKSAINRNSSAAVVIGSNPKNDKR